MSIKQKLIYLNKTNKHHNTITLRDGNELVVENCRGVSGCDDNFITLSVYGMELTVAGTPLILESFGTDGVRISGKIHSLTLEEKTV